jgi:RNA polymerase sigma-70 factor (ECF subfamily)
MAAVTAKTIDAEPRALSRAAPAPGLHDSGAAAMIGGGRRIGGLVGNGVERRRSTSGMEDRRDEELLALVGSGDRQAYHVLVERHGRRVLAMARRMTGNPAEAEDVAQDAFLRVWQRAGDWRDQGAKFTTWLYRVVMNLCLDRRRRKPMAPLEAAGDPADERPDAETALAAGERSRHVEAALAMLPERQRAALVLSYYEGLNNAAAAAALDISVAALESLLVRARRGLRAELEKRGVIAAETEEP